MMRALPAIAGMLLALACGCASAGPLRAGHPLLGTWEIKVPGTSCVETKTVLPNGRVSTTSNEEVTESEADIADKPDAQGFFKWVDRTVKDNGKPDCGGQVTSIGDVATVWVHLDASGDHHVLCFSHGFSECVGPYVRRKGSPS